jgi:hypothetical protein
VSEVLFRLGVTPIYGKAGALAKTLELNPKIRANRGDRVYPGDEILLPIMPGSPAIPSPVPVENPVPVVTPAPPVPQPVSAPVSVETIDDPGEKPRAFVIDLGLGFSYLDYKETIASSNFKLTEYGITLKGGFGYKLSPRVEVGGNAFVTAVPFKKSSEPNALTTARFYGVNGRIGYLFSDLGPRAKLYVFTGWYAWGMATSPAPAELSYGITYLGGPQLVVSGRFKTESGRRFSTYLKFATMQDTAGISLSNREIAAGGSYEVSPLSHDGERHRPWLLSLDLAQARFSQPSHSFELLSATLGLSTPL